MFSCHLFVPSLGFPGYMTFKEYLFPTELQYLVKLLLMQYYKAAKYMWWRAGTAIHTQYINRYISDIVVLIDRGERATLLPLITYSHTITSVFLFNK